MNGHRIDWPNLLDGAKLIGVPPSEVSSICYDSRAITSGSVFVAIPGAMPPLSRDGHDFLLQALDKGASVIVAQADHVEKWEAPARSGRAAFVIVEDTAQALALVAAAFYGFPARQLKTVSVTGTDGKTTTVHLIDAVLEAGGLSTGFLSSVEFKTSGEPQLNATHMTTLQSPEVQALLAEMVAADRECAVIEASSHGLALHRVDECEFDVAVFTTLSRDHLDFHGTLEEYLSAKGRLFSMLDESMDKGIAKTAVLNADDPASEYLRSCTQSRAITYGIEGRADVRAEEMRFDGLQSSFTIAGPFGRIGAQVPLGGRHGVYDALAAVSVGISLSVAPGAIVEGLSGFRGVPGRLEVIDGGQPFRVVVDIASTPEALRRALEVLRPLTAGRLWVVFGCAGERDTSRRDGMGKAAGEMADFTVLTNEDPRTEAPEAIIDSIVGGLAAAGRREGEDFVRVLDRREAIGYAFERAKEGDTVLLAGKATEQSIVVGREHIPWDERKVARELLREIYQEAV
jgi:UDP-N-acetylmuramoyl-L-alanyl-D-glutamate--2,6-diaminopimelate ligase